jgi:hypothetical protein
MTEATGTSSHTLNTTARKIRETSQSLLRPTAGQINAKYKPPESPVKPIRVSSARISNHLIQSTAGLELAKYKKQTPDIDPRELGWRSYGRKLSEASSIQPERGN